MEKMDGRDVFRTLPCQHVRGNFLKCYRVKQKSTQCPNFYIIYFECFFGLLHALLYESRLTSTITSTISQNGQTQA